MKNTEQKCSEPDRVFDFVERNLPRQDTDDDTAPMSVVEYVLWMLGISSAFFAIAFVVHLIFY